MSAAVGPAVGLFAGLVLLASAALLSAALPLLPDRRSPAALLVAAAAAGVPPGLAFGGRVLGLADAFETGNAFGVVAVAGAATWLVAAAAAARSVGLPAGRRRQATDVLALVAAVLGVMVLAAGPAVRPPDRKTVVAGPRGVLGAPGSLPPQTPFIPAPPPPPPR